MDGGSLRVLPRPPYLARRNRPSSSSLQEPKTVFVLLGDMPRRAMFADFGSNGGHFEEMHTFHGGCALCLPCHKPA